MIRVCRKEGNNNPDLWVQVLSYLVNNVPSSGDIQESSPLPDNAGDGNPAGGKSEDGGGGGDVSSDDGEGAGGEEGRWDDVRELLALIERDQVLSPLQVMICFFVRLGRGLVFFPGAAGEGERTCILVRSWSCWG